MRLTLLAPDIVEAILDGRQAEGVTLPQLMKPFPLVWYEQRSPVRRRLSLAWPAAGTFRPRIGGEDRVVMGPA
jgi:hypothetical protein